jgi:hypothetical protein
MPSRSVTRAAIAGALIVSFVALPLAMDLCAASCEAETNAAGVAALGPTCHHIVSANAVIRHVPISCAYEHAESAFVAAAGPSVAPRAMTSPAGASTTVMIGSNVIPLSDHVEAASPPRRPARLALSSTLRI